MARFLTTLVVSTALPFTVSCSSPTPTVRSVVGTAQGTTYSLQWVGGPDERTVAAAAEQELERIDLLLSNYRPDSELERFNAIHGVEPVTLPAELVELLQLAGRVHGASDGCFDPTVRPLVRAWGFDTESPAEPPADVLERARHSAGIDKLLLVDATHVRKTAPDLELDMASIGQGYTAARLAAVLEEHGTQAYLAEIGGEIVAQGSKADGTPWRIGVENPTGEGPAPALRMPRERTAVVTSGTYRHYFDSDGRRFSHIIDPRTGRPVDHTLQAVTVVGSDATTAAAWATALLCLGPTRAREVAEHEDLAALLWVSPGEVNEAPEQTSAFTARWRDLLEQRGR